MTYIILCNEISDINYILRTVCDCICKSSKLIPLTSGMAIEHFNICDVDFVTLNHLFDSAKEHLKLDDSLEITVHGVILKNGKDVGRFNVSSTIYENQTECTIRLIHEYLTEQK